MCCIHYAFNINVNELECNEYFSTVWCSCAQITAMHTELWIKWASDVGQWFQKTLVDISLWGSSVKLEVTIYLLFPSIALSLRLYEEVKVGQWSSQAVVSLKAMQQCSMFVWRLSHCSTAIYSTLIFYMPVVLSLGKFSLANIFLHSDQPTTTPLAFHLYSHLLHPPLGHILYKQDQNCPNWQTRAQ